MKPIIEAVRDPNIASNADFAKINGEPARKPMYYRHEDGSEYFHIQGALAWPTISEPGCALVVGVTREDLPIYKVLDARFSKHPSDLLRDCIALKSTYTPIGNLRLLQPWVGEDLFSSLLAEVNVDQKLKLFFIPPPDIEKQNCYQIYIEKIRAMSEAGRVAVVPQSVLDELKSITATDTEKPLASFPAVAATGYALHYLTVRQPWLTSVGPPKVQDY
jgi:hypothetical protein